MTPIRYRSAALLALLLASCATYSDRTGAALRDFREANFVAAEITFAEKDNTHSAFLSGTEAGLVALTDGRFDTALVYFKRAFVKVRDLEEAALVDPEALGRGLSTWALSEELSDYVGEGYERVMLHALWGLAYLGLGNVEDMMVEVRRSNRLLVAEERFHGSDYRAGGLATFLSAIGHELTGQLDEAYIDYKALAKLGVAESLHGPSLVRLSRSLGLAEATAQWEAKFGTVSPVPDGSARVILIAGLGMGPTKREARLSVATDDGLLVVVLPEIVYSRHTASPITLHVSENAVRSTQLEDIERLASESLKDRTAWLVARSLVRTVVKRELRQKLDDEIGVTGAIIGDVFNMVTERADLRCWSTLPGSWAAARIFVPSGEHSLSVEVPGGGLADLGRVHLDPGETMFVFARTMNRDIHARQVGGQQVNSQVRQDPIP
jgi:hypothetical protein